MNLCNTCGHWKDPSETAEPWETVRICHPIDNATREPMVMPFEVRVCTHPKLTRFERTPERNGFGVKDASEFSAALTTGPDFGCVRHSALEHEP